MKIHEKATVFLLLLTVIGSTAACTSVPTTPSVTETAIESETGEDVSTQSEPQSSVSSETDTETTTKYSYDGLEEFWYEPQESRGGMTNCEALSTMASPDADMDAFIHSRLGEYVMTSRALLEVGNISSSGFSEYWASLDAVHEVHDTENEAHQWVSIVPADVISGQNAERPLLFIWHGNNNPLELAETYGFIEPAIERGWLVVLPWANNDDDYLEEFDRILKIMEDSYSVDPSRIYTTGFSKGGRVSAHLALERSQVLAASAVCGTNAATEFTNPDGSELELTGPQMLTDSDFETAQKNIPILFWGGNLDVFGAMPYNNENKIRSINNWLKLHGINSLQSIEDSEKLIASKDQSVEAAIGLHFDKTEIIKADGTLYYIGSYLNADGKEVIQIINAQDAIHLPTPSTGQSAVSFLEKHSK